MGRHCASVEFHERAVAASPELRPALGRALLRAADYQQALVCAELVLARQPRSLPAFTLKAECLYRLCRLASSCCILMEF